EHRLQPSDTEPQWGITSLVGIDVRLRSGIQDAAACWRHGNASGRTRSGTAFDGAGQPEGFGA
ncbi:unnamed protein product, partial [Durusdinium trenchii]